ncbi:KTSC domain-containing protein [Phenylobacterium sp.]|uniref:KTSC domain-containing protein n=1 Tax=Phenylobacterium sp. TaxID=1871053 RepID=UPI0026386254|nr:KTSC domain-containing protein [Phenylobacterium sp.]
MERQSVKSSNLKSIGYDAADETLEVEFKNGTVYHYYNVPHSIHESLMSATSHGSYLNDHVKNRYKYRRIL